MKNKKIFIIILLVILVCILSIILIVNNTNDKEKTKSSSNNCTPISNSISSGKDTILFYDNGDFSEDINDIIISLKEEYNLNNIYKIKNNSNCIEKVNNDEDVKQIIKDESLVVLYKNNSLVNFSTVHFDYYEVVNFLKENQFVKDDRQEETTTLEEVKTKIKNNKYVVFIVNSKQEYNNAVNVITEYTEYEYDIIFYNSLKGEKIYEHLLDNYNISNEVPEFVYFQNGKVVINDTFDKANFKEQMNKK